MPSKSKKQRRFMAAAANNPKFARKAGIKQSVAKEFHAADKRGYAGGGLVYAAGGRPIPTGRAGPQRLLGPAGAAPPRKPVVPRPGIPGGALAHFRAAQRAPGHARRHQIPPGGRLGPRRGIPGKDPLRPGITPPPGKQPNDQGGYSIPTALGDRLRRMRVGMSNPRGVRFMKKGGHVGSIRDLRKKLLSGELTTKVFRQRLLDDGYSESRIKKIIEETKAGD